MTALDQAWTAWGQSALLSKWKAANPGEARKLDTYRLGGIRPELATPVGRALVYETDAWLNSIIPPVPPSPATGFVTRQGSQLLLDGKPYTFRGICCYGLLGKCGPDGTGLPLPPGAVVRFWAFRSQVNPDWQNLDEAVHDAKSAGLKLIPVLRNDARDSNGVVGCNGDTEETVYRTFLQQIASRYRDEPTILFWQLGNELVRSGDWHREHAAIVRAADPNHLVSYGEYLNKDHANVYLGDDIRDGHDYDQGSTPLPKWLADELTLATSGSPAFGTPFIVGESGISTSIDPNTRRDWFKAKMDAAFQAGASGYLIWSWKSDDGFGVFPGDPSLELLA